MRRAAVLALLLPLMATADDAGVDPSTGLIRNPGWLSVRAHCGGCHSHALVTSQRADRDTWLATIRWMQASQNLWQFEPDVENEILDYLAENYAPLPARRRAPLPSSLMPSPPD